MTLTIDIAPDLEQQLRAEAARRGVDENAFIVQTLGSGWSKDGGGRKRYHPANKRNSWPSPIGLKS